MAFKNCGSMPQFLLCLKRLRYNRYMDVSRNQQGFTLIEVVITAVFVTAASAAIISVFITIGRMNKEARNMETATALAQQKIETYRNMGYSAIPTGAPAET